MKFKGIPMEEESMFNNPGYRGVDVLPYSKKVKKMVNQINNRVRK